MQAIDIGPVMNWAKVCMVLGKDFFIWRGIIEATIEKIKVLQKKLQPFDDLWNRKSKVST